MDFLSIFALVLLFSIGIAFAYGLIILHDIPYKIAKKRNHPHAEAIEAAGWVSLFLMHAIWPFLWIWAMLYHPQRGFSTSPEGVAVLPASGEGSSPESPLDAVAGESSAKAPAMEESLRSLERKLAALEARIARTGAASPPEPSPG